MGGIEVRERIRSHLTYSNVTATLAVFLVLGGISYAATGGNFILGQSNTAGSRSTLSAPIADKALAVTNTSAKAGATALGLNVASGHAPFKVNSPTKVANLNADKLDGQDSAAFQRRVSDGCAEHRAISAIAANGSVACEGAVIPIDLSSPNNAHREVRVGDLRISTTCAEVTGFKRVFFTNQGSVGATLNWLYGDGTTVFADGVAMGASAGPQFPFAGKRLEGQFIFSSPTQKTTVNLHAFDSGSSGCEVHGTVTYAPSS
jgi:hypothetical protein